MHRRHDSSSTALRRPVAVAVAALTATVVAGTSLAGARPPLALTIDAPATLEARRSVTVGADASTPIRGVDVEVGQRVSAGQRLAWFDSASARVAHLQAATALASAREALRKLTAPPPAATLAEDRAALREARLAVRLGEARLAAALRETESEAVRTRSREDSPARLQARLTLAGARARLREAREKAFSDTRRARAAAERAEQAVSTGRSDLERTREARSAAAAIAASTATTAADAVRARQQREDEQLDVQAELERRQAELEAAAERAQGLAAAESAACADDPATPEREADLPACAAARSARTAADARVAASRSEVASRRDRLSQLAKALVVDGRAVADTARARADAEAALARAEAKEAEATTAVTAAVERRRTVRDQGATDGWARRVAIREAEEAVVGAKLALRTLDEDAAAKRAADRLARRAALRDAREAVERARLGLRAREEARAARLAGGSRQEIEAARSSLAAAVAAEKAARAAVEATTLRAPFDGIVSAIGRDGAERGVTISSVSELVAAAEVSAFDAPRVQIGQRALVTAAGGTFSGRVASIGVTPTREEGEPRYLLRVVFASPTDLRPGMPARITIRVRVAR